MFFKQRKASPFFLFLLGALSGFLLGVAVYYFLFAQQGKTLMPSTSSEPVASFDITPYDHFQGNYNAPVTLVVFNDFTCPYCQQYALTLEKLISDYQNKVRLVWKHFPLNQNYLLAAVASECADEQGKFWQYAHGLYTRQEPYNHDFYLQLAHQLNLDVDKFETCLSSDKYEAKIKADYYEGVMKGVLGAPATFINGHYFPGAIPLTELKDILDRLLTQ